VEACVIRASVVYAGSDGDLTKAYYVQLEQHGPVGVIAMNLFRAQKCSARAKVYRGGGFKGMAYERKNWSMANLSRALIENAATVCEQLGIAWGWKEDPAQEYHSWVLYVDLPTGQCSFHARSRGEGPDYLGEWDRVPHASADRILAFCDWVIGGGECIPVRCGAGTPGESVIPGEIESSSTSAQCVAGAEQTNLFDGASNGPAS
jgi:hypothetical protein